MKKNLPVQLYKESPYVKTNLGRLMAAQYYWDKGCYQEQAVFHLFANQAIIMPDVAPLAIFLKTHHFTAFEVEYLASLGLAERFLNALQRMKPGLTFYAMPKDAFVLATQPILILKATYVEAQVCSIPIFHFLEASISTSLLYECIDQKLEQGNWQTAHLNPGSILNFEETDRMQAVFISGKFALESEL
ncbi:MAG: hypothetical protein SFU99_23195 [Saprospiraceae bacterium]|nr:hypothetical protein [Saprospiraceae bacterium]